MVGQYQGHYPYDKNSVDRSCPRNTGVYYCGIIENLKLTPLYIGKASGIYGLHGRLSDHLSENKWYDITHFGFVQCSSEAEALMHEANEIARFKPKYNVQGK